MVCDPVALQGRKILVTGATGQVAEPVVDRSNLIDVAQHRRAHRFQTQLEVTAALEALEVGLGARVTSPDEMAELRKVTRSPDVIE